MENQTPKSLEEQLADANARIAELEAQNSSTQAPADNGSQAGGEGDEAPAASAPAPAVEPSAAEAVAEAPAAEAPAPVAQPQHDAAPAADSELRFKAIEDVQKEIQATLARISTQQAIAGSETTPVGSETPDNGQSNTEDELQGIAATEAAFESDLKALRGGE